MATIKETFSKGITTLNVKTSGMLEQNKINTHISTLRKEIEDLKNEAGHVAYDRWSQGNFAAEDLTEYFEQVNQKLQEIEDQKEKLEEIRREGEAILGAAQKPAGNTSPGQISGDVIFCANCGGQVAANHKFCTKCGTPVG